YGITESGNFPYIEMEFIEGPDLSEILKQEGRPIFKIKELLLFAEHLSNAIAHCHMAGVKHGDIKSNNVKLNKRTGNYVLLDFGLSVMTDEQRRTSFRHAGAIEFMAPEQNDGDLFFETDIYSFGIILFELISGQVPFPLDGNGETSRNKVMMAHLDSLPPDMLSLRKAALPATWNNQDKDAEMNLPQWLINMTLKCLEKKPTDRFANGIQLHDYVMKHVYTAVYNEGISQNDLDVLIEENKRLQREKLLLQEQLQQSQTPVSFNDYQNSFQLQNKAEKRTWRIKANIAALILLLVTAALVYYFITNKGSNDNLPSTSPNTQVPDANTQAALADAKEHLDNSRLAAALLIYKNLSDRNIPNAMYQYGNLALEGRNTAITCAEGINLIDKASNAGYAAAKKTLGLLYAFADDESFIKQRGYTSCTYTRNINEGAKLLMEASLLGDDEAAKLLIELNARVQSGRWKN
ncbi:MAG: serine/threonine-protein kinase, partial [Ferruginibacter sp.]